MDDQDLRGRGDHGSRSVNTFSVAVLARLLVLWSEDVCNCPWRVLSFNQPSRVSLFSIFPFVKMWLNAKKKKKTHTKCKTDDYSANKLQPTFLWHYPSCTHKHNFSLNTFWKTNFYGSLWLQMTFQLLRLSFSTNSCDSNVPIEVFFFFF